MPTSDLLRILHEPTTVRRLDNGLTIVVRERRRSPVVALVTCVRAGYLDESDDLVGISHVLEHMYFKGTSRRGPGAIARETKDAGGYLNASTSYDLTRYYTVLPARALEQGLDVQSDALRDSLVDADELGRELRVIIEEAKRKRDTPTALARETMYATLLDEHRMRRWRIGTEEQLATYDRDAVYGFYRRWYRPESIVVAIAGDVEAEEALDRAAHHYGDLPGGARPDEHGPPEPMRRGFRYATLSGDVSRTYIEAGWRGPPMDGEDAPALAMLATVLGSGRASRLYREVREPGHALSVSAGSYGTRDIGVFSVSAETAAAGAVPALDAIGRTLARVRDGGITDEEVERARRLLSARTLAHMETVEGQANFLADWQSRGAWTLGVDWLRNALQADADALVEAARRRLDPDLASVVVYAPEGTDPPDVQDVAGALHAAPVAGPAPVETAPVPLARASADATGEEDGVRFYRSPNANIAVQPLATGLATVSISIAGGTVEETPSVAGFTSLAMRLTPRGTRRRDADEIARITESLGGVVQAFAGDDRFEWRITVPAADVHTALALLGEVAFEPRFAADVFDRERRMKLQDLARVRDDMYHYPLTRMLTEAWGGHPYGFALSTLESALGEAGVDDLRAWHEARIRRTPWIVVAGDVNPDDVARSAAALPAQGGPAPDAMAAPAWPDAPRETYEALDRAQTGIAIGMPGPPRDDADRYALSLAGAAVSGLGGRAFEELRSRRSLAYVVSLRPSVHRLAGTFVGYIATSPDREDEARTELLAEMVRLTTDGVEEDELERAKNYAIGTWDIRRQTTASVASDLVGALVLGDGVRELREYRDRIRALTTDDVRAAARRWIDPRRAVTGIVRGTRV